MRHKPGAILLVSVCFNDENGNGGDVLGDEPEWAVVRETPEEWMSSDEWTFVDWLTISGLPVALQHGYDEWCEIPEDEVPDEIWVALAKLRLIGAVNGS